jgi:hypothetical protein
MNTGEKGRRNEHRSMAVLEEQGYACIRSSNSRSPWDVVALRSSELVLVQVKSSRWPGSQEVAAMRAFPCPPGCRRLVHRWRRGQSEPDVREVRA